MLSTSPLKRKRICFLLLHLLALEFKDSQINSLLLKTNSLEQYNRSWSIRVNGLAISSEEEKDSFLVKQKVYDNLLLPILTAAVDNGDLHSVPRVDDLLEAAHILPARDNKAKPVIARFFTRDMRSLVFRFKKEFAPRVREEPGLLADGRRPTALADIATHSLRISPA